MQESVRGLRRLMFDLYPHSLCEQGLVAALRESLVHLTNDAGIRRQLHATEDLADLDPDVADGFDVEAALADPEHRGLRAIKQRVELASGRLQIDTRHGVGTFADVWIPLAAARDR